MQEPAGVQEMIVLHSRTGVCCRNAAERRCGEPADVPLFRLRHHAVLIAQWLHPLHDPHGQDEG